MRISPQYHRFDCRVCELAQGYDIDDMELYELLSMPEVGAFEAEWSVELCNDVQCPICETVYETDWEGDNAIEARPRVEKIKIKGRIPDLGSKLEH